MMHINHSDALALENTVRRLFKCGRSGVSGLADADIFEAHPMYAAIMVISCIHAKGLQKSETQYDEFLTDYDYIFNNPDEYDIEKEVQNYKKELSEIVDQYL